MNNRIDESNSTIKLKDIAKMGHRTTRPDNANYDATRNNIINKAVELLEILTR